MYDRQKADWPTRSKLTIIQIHLLPLAPPVPSPNRLEVIVSVLWAFIKQTCTHLCLSLSLCLFLCLCLYPWLWLCLCLCLSLSLCVSVCLPACLPVCLSVCLSLSVCLYVSLSLSLIPHPLLFCFPLLVHCWIISPRLKFPT